MKFAVGIADKNIPCAVAGADSFLRAIIDELKFLFIDRDKVVLSLSGFEFY